MATAIANVFLYLTYLSLFLRRLRSVRIAAPIAVDINKNSTAIISTTRLLNLYEIPTKIKATVKTAIMIRVTLSSFIITPLSFAY